VKRQIDCSNSGRSDERLVCVVLVNSQIDYSSRGGLIKG
jgi:hypothetical protein